MNNLNIYRHRAWADTGGLTGEDYERHLQDPVSQMIKNWAGYADQHRKRYKESILDDGVLGPCWEGVGMDLRELLNGHLAVDAGTMDSIIVAVFQNEGLVV